MLFEELNYEGQRVRVGFTWGGPPTYLFPGNWGSCHPGHYAAAWEELHERSIRGFEDPVITQIRMTPRTGTKDVPVLRMRLEVLIEDAHREHRKFVDRLKVVAPRYSYQPDPMR